MVRSNHVRPLNAHHTQEHDRESIPLARYFFCSGPIFCLVLVTIQYPECMQIPHAAGHA